jgi:hypothetical protein
MQWTASDEVSAILGPHSMLERLAAFSATALENMHTDRLALRSGADLFAADQRVNVHGLADDVHNLLADHAAGDLAP